MRFIKALTLTFLVALLIFPVSAFADKTCPNGNTVPDNAVCLNLDYPAFGGYDPNENQDLNQIVAWFYYFIVAISGFAAFYTIVIAGFSWLTSGGNASQINSSKDRITTAFIGLIIILASFLILQILNPELTTLNLPDIKTL